MMTKKRHRHKHLQQNSPQSKTKKKKKKKEKSNKTNHKLLYDHTTCPLLDNSIYFHQGKQLLSLVKPSNHCGNNIPL